MRTLMGHNFQFDTFGLAEVWYLNDLWQWTCYYIDEPEWARFPKVRP